MDQLLGISWFEKWENENVFLKATQAIIGRDETGTWSRGS